MSNILHDELNDPRLGFVTITGAELSPDLRYARVFYSVLGEEQDLQRTKDALDSAVSFIRRLVGQRVRFEVYSGDYL